VVLSGAVTPEQLRSNVAGASVALGGDELASLAPLAEAASEYWRRRSELAWS
jgi:aryl-alcohol dehydrogenase-like predicted oxidoreductase